MIKKIFSVILCFQVVFFINMPFVLAASQSQIKEANNLAKTAHEAYGKFNYQKAGDFYKKAYQLNPLPVYKENYTVAYTSYAFDRATDKDYPKALEICNMLLKENPNNKKVHELLAEIYYSRGLDSFYAGNVEKAKLDLMQSKKYAVDSEQKQKIDEGINKIDSMQNRGLKPVPRTSSKNSNKSLPLYVSEMEAKTLGQADYSLSLVQRVSRLEKSAFGKSFDNEGLVARVERLKGTLLPEEPQPQASGSAYYNENDYIPEIIEQSMGKVSIQGRMPITVYFEQPDVKTYKGYYKQAAKEGFEMWAKASDNKIKFAYVNDPARAMIKVVWQEEFDDYHWKPELKTEDLAEKKNKQKYQKASMVVRIGSIGAMILGALVGVPFIGSVGAVGGSVASPILHYKAYGSKDDRPTIPLNTSFSKGLAEDKVRPKIKQIAAHQMGHALGIFGHSSNSKDIMCEDFSVYELSQRDKNTIKEIYKSVNLPKNQKKKFLFF